jgi:DNA-directed RNA polymerase subunit RPC12/RpoP
MESNNLENVTPNTNDNNVKIVKTDEGSTDGLNRCPKCGATDILLNPKTGKLRCSYCRHEFDPEKITGMEEDIKNLTGEIMGSGAQNIIADTNSVLTFKCTSCGAEIVVDTSEASHARCHWCRNVLSVNQQIPNGTIPDVVLPFKLTKDQAKACIEKFVGKRKFFANSKFRQEFTTENIMGVYFPYMIVDVNSHAKLIGQGEHLVRFYTVKSGNSEERRYDADLYDVEREFDLAIKGLTIESNSDRLNNEDKSKTNNVINAIMPFDTENAVKYDSNYMRGYTSEKRNVNVDELKELVKVQSKDVARFATNDSLKNYDRGVAWSSEEFNVKGQQWKAAYLPVWLYSYQEVKGDKKVLHYVAVNARTEETMGSVPIHMPKLILMSFLVEVLGILAMMFTADDFDGSWLFLTVGVIFFFIMYGRYRNSGARHTYETETEKEVTNLREVDTYIKRRTGLSNYYMEGANNTNVEGATSQSKLLKRLTDTVPEVNMVKDFMENSSKKENEK